MAAAQLPAAARGRRAPAGLEQQTGAPIPTELLCVILGQWSSGMPHYAFIETSQFGGPDYRAPTPDEFRGEMRDAIAHGAPGIFYFTLGKGDVQGSVEPDVVTEMQRQLSCASSR